jgi:hypothetical protein
MTNFGMEVKVDLSEYHDFTDGLERMNQSIPMLLMEFGLVGQNILIDKAVTISAQGELARSIQFEIGDDYVSIFSKLLYGLIALETGRASGKMPPIQAIERWAIRRGMKKNVAFLIARKIAKQGTEKFIKGGPKLLTEALREYSDAIDPIILNFINKFL